MSLKMVIPDKGPDTPLNVGDTVTCRNPVRGLDAHCGIVTETTYSPRRYAEDGIHAHHRYAYITVQWCDGTTTQGREYDLELTLPP